MVPFNPSAMFAVVLVLATLFMCSRVGPSYSADHIYPNPGPVVAPTTFIVHLVDRPVLVALLRKHNLDLGAGAVAFWRLKPCEIYITIPSFLGLYTWAGLVVHEIKHCIYGAYHN